MDVETTVDIPTYVKKRDRYDLRDLTCPLKKVPQPKPKDESENEIAPIIAKNNTNPDFFIREYSPEKGNLCKSVEILRESSWPSMDLFGMDPSQYAALKAALTKQFTLIQGPPGNC